MHQNHKTPAPDRPVADANTQNWVDRFCPLWSRPYLRLSRADRPIGTWLLLLPCWWGLGLANLQDRHDTLDNTLVWFYGLFALGAFLMRGAGCTWNDITDCALDAQVTRTQSRPLPSGQISIKQAFAWLGLQLALSAIIVLQFNLFTVFIGLAAIIPVGIYPFAKRFTWWPQVFLGIAFNWGALLSWAAFYGRIEWPAICLYLSGIAWTLFYDTIYAHQDKEDDALIGIKSTARLFAQNTPQWLCFFGTLSVLLLSAGVFIANAPLIAWMGIIGFALCLIWQLWMLNIDNPANCLRLFRTNKNAGLIIVIGFICADLLSPYFG